MIAPDERLEAFLSLLRAPPASSAHLALLDDNTLYGSLAFYLSSLAEPAQAARLVRAVACSGALWASPTPRLVAEGSEGILPTRAHNLSRAVAQATTRRLDLLLRARLGASGWGTQRALGQWVHALVQAAESDDLVGAATGGSVDDDASGTTLLAAWTAAGADPHLAGLYGTPLPRLAILTGLFLGLNAVGEERSGGTRPSKGVSLRKIKATVESEWLTTLGHSVVMIQRVLSTASQGPSGPQDASDDAWEKEFARRLVVMEPSPYPATWTLAARRTVWEATFLLVGQAGQYVSEKRVRALLPAVPLAQVASDAIVGLYEQYDLPTVIDLGGHGVPAKLEALRQDRIYPWLGPLSRVTSYALGQTVLELTPDEALDLILGTGSEKVVPSLLKRIEDMSAALSHAWAQSPLSSSPSGEDQRVKDQIWTELRRFVFSSTMLFEALVESLVDMVPSPTESIALPDVEAPNEFHAATASNIPAPYLAAVQSCLHTYGRMYFVVNVFGSDTLTAYKRVFYTCLDLLQRDAQASLHFLLAILPSGPSGQGTEQGSLSQKVFYLDAAEQLVSAAPDSLIERQVLPLAHPFLESNKAPNAFESAHSLVLAIFANRKALCRDLAPYYVPLLLKVRKPKLR